jgi:hypothetical protein
MALYGPIIVAEMCTYNLEWAHSSYREKLLMISYGPTLTAKTDCQWPCMGPSKLLRCVAYNLDWAHYHYRGMLPMIWYGPILTAKTNCL